MNKIVNGKRIYKSDPQQDPRRNARPNDAPYQHRRPRKAGAGDHSSAGREWLSWLVLPLALICYEIIFRQATGEKILCVQMLAASAASIAIGTLLFCFCSLFRRPGINRAIKAVLIFVSALPFLVQYYVFRAFKTFYDLRTMFFGTNDVVGKGFLDEALDTVLNRTGLLYLGLFLLPFLLYIILVRRADPASPFRGRSLIRTVCVLLLSLGSFAAIVLYVPGMRDHYRQFYNYTNAVNSYGLLTGMCLDIAEGESGTVSFDEVDPPDDVRPPREDTAGEDVPVVYEPNVLNIDFAALAETSPEPYSSIDAYVAMQTPTMKNRYTGLFEGKNLIMITAEAFSAEVIDEERTPTLYRLATRGINFTDFMQSATAGTIGGEFQVIFGMPSVRGGASFEYLLNDCNSQTMGWQLNERGYYGIAFHNNDYTYYNRNRTHNVLGYSEGFYGYGNGLEEFLTDTFPKSDLEMMEGTVDWYIDHQPFNVYYMTFSGHNSYNFRYNDMAWKNRESVEGLPYSETVRAYLAANMELEHALAYLVSRLEEAGIAEDTVIVLCADHFPYGLDYEATLGNMPCLSELYGYDVENYMDRDHNRLIIWSGCLENDDPIIVDAPTSSLDILPTLLNLFGLEYDSRLFVGRDVFSDADPLVFDLFYNWKTDFGRYLSSTGTFEPYDEDAVIPDGYVDRMKTVVKNRIKFCEAVVDNDYFRHVMENCGKDVENAAH